MLGTFYVLAHLKRIALNEGVTCLMQECNIGVFPVEVHSEQGRVVRVVMSQPKPEFLEPIKAVDEVYSVGRALGLPKPGVVETNWELQVVSTGLPVLIVPVRTLTAVRSIIPDASAITPICERFGANGIMVFTTVTVESFTSVHARMFAPKIGILEDPATGSAAGALGPTWFTTGSLRWVPLRRFSSSKAMRLTDLRGFLSRWSRTMMSFKGSRSAGIA